MKLSQFKTIQIILVLRFDLQPSIRERNSRRKRSPYYIVTKLCTSTYSYLTEFAVLICLCIYVPDDNLLEVETRRRHFEVRHPRCTQ